MRILSAVQTTLSCVQIYLWIRDASQHRTASWVPMVSYIWIKHRCSTRHCSWSLARSRDLTLQLGVMDSVLILVKASVCLAVYHYCFPITISPLFVLLNGLYIIHKLYTVEPGWNLSLKDTLNKGHLSNEDTYIQLQHLHLQYPVTSHLGHAYIRT